MKLSKTIEGYTIFYCRCCELSSELANLSTRDYVDGKDDPVRRRLCYYAELVFEKGKELNDLGIDVDMHETFRAYAEMSFDEEEAA